MLEAEQVKPEPLVSEVKAEKLMVLETPRAVSRRPIRPPFRILWREFRFRLLPAIAFVLAVLGAIIMWRNCVIPQEVSPVGSVFAGSGSPGIAFNPTETVAGK